MRSASRVHRLPAQASLLAGFSLRRWPAICSASLGMIVYALLAHVAERRGVGHRVIDIEQQQAADLRRFLLPVAPVRRRSACLPRRLALVFQLLHVVAEGVDQIVGELPVALPSVAQQVQMGLLGLEAAQVVDGIEVRQARVVEQVLLRDPELGQQCLGDQVQRLQRGALLPFVRHLRHRSAWRPA